MLDAGLPRYLSLLFFLPFANLLFFARLTVIPSQSALQGLPAEGWMAHGPTQPRPHSQLGAQVFWVLWVGALESLPLWRFIFVFEF